MPRRYYFPKLSPSGRRMRYVGRKSLIAIIFAALLGTFVAADRMGVFGRGQHGRTRAPRSESVAEDLATFDGRKFKVVHVVDGDTIDIDVPGPHAYCQRIRLIGVDTPETVKPNTPVEHFGPEASAFTKKTALNQTVTLQLDPTHDTRDRYDRLLAYIVLPDGRMLNRVLVEEGYGYAYPLFAHPHKKEFEKLQKDAMKARRGLWKDVANDQLPEYYRDKLTLPGGR
ncbi:MAG: thermonuclease family protein [Phycisphaerae bacterium]